jgi:hypothetical protein
MGDRNTSFQSQVGNANDAVTEQTGDNNMADSMQNG